MSSLLLISLLVAASGPAAPSEPAVHTVADDELGLQKGSVFDAPAPPPVQDNASDPGERPPLGRAHPEAPPATPHAIADFLPITRTDNLCIDCHAVQEKLEGEPTPIPPSHYVDLRNAPETTGERVTGSRWVCVSCHLAQTDAEPLVGNPLGAAAAAGDR